MKGKTDFACVDVGTTKICTVCAHVDEEEVVQVLGVGTSPARGLDKGAIIDINEAKRAFRDSITQAETLGNRKVTSATLGISGRHLSSSFNSSGAVRVSRANGLVISADLRHVLNSATSVGTFDNTALLHVIPRTYAIDGQTGVRNPVGMYGSRLEVETHVITAVVAPVRNLVKCVRSLDIGIDDLVLNLLASSEAVLTQDEKNEGIILADIGGETTEIAAFKDGSIYHTSILPIGGQQLTRDIASGLRLPLSEAEQIKKKYGNLMRIEQESDTNITILGNAQAVSLQDLNEIIRMRMEELLQLIVLELPNKSYYNLAPAGLVITGGTANLPGIAELAEQLIRIPVRIGITRSVHELSGVDIAPEYATLAGLLLWCSQCLRKDRLSPIKQVCKNVTKSTKVPEAKGPAPKRDKDIRDYEEIDELRKPQKVVRTSYVPSGARIKVVGLGGAGCNAVTRMARGQIHGVELIAMNSDAQNLAITETAVRIQLGEQVTRGLGAGGDPTMGRKVANESYDEIRQVVSGADMVFIAAGMGGGTGTGSAPVVAEIAKHSGALTIAVVTKPFSFEGTHRTQVAEEGIMDLISKVDTLIIIPNDHLLDLIDQKMGVDSVFKMADEILYYGVQAIAEVITVPGLINLDFADVRTVMKDAGPAWMSIGKGSGQNRARDATTEALSSPLLDVSLAGAKGVLFNIAGGSNLTLFEVNDAAAVIQRAIDPEANVIFGVVHDPSLGEEVRVTLVVTGFATKEEFAGPAREKELTQLIKGLKAEEKLEVPSFLRRTGPVKPSLDRKPAINNAILEKGYSIFQSTSKSKERSSRLKNLRDQIMRSNPDDPTVELLNSLWRLSQDVTSVPDYASTMIRLLRPQSPKYETNPLYGFYSFISSACDIKSASDFGRIPLKVIGGKSELLAEVSNIVRIPTQIVRVSEMVESLSNQSLIRSYIDWLKRSQGILSELADSLKPETKTPEVVCFNYVIERWMELISGAINVTLSNLKCYLATNEPIYSNRVNEIQIAVSGGVPGQSFHVSAPVTQKYAVQLNDASFAFQDPITYIDLRIRPHDAGPLTILIQIEGITFEMEALALLENPFILIPVQSEEMFVGRQELVDRIIRGIVAPQPTNFLIIGRRRIGKTSLLLAIKRQLPKGILPVLLSTEACGESPTEVCLALANGISRAISETQIGCQSGDRFEILQNDPIGGFASWLQTLPKQLHQSSLQGIVLLIDEAIDLIEWDERVQKLLRYIFSSMTWVRGVLASTPDIIERMTADVPAHLYNIFATVKLGPLSKKDTEKLLLGPLQRCGIEGSENMFNAIYDYSGGIPYYVQAIGQELIEHYSSKGLIGEELLSKTFVQVQERTLTSYPATLRKLSAEQKIFMILIANGINPPGVSAKRLEQVDLIENDGGKWVIRAGIEKEWIRRDMDQLLDSAGEELWDEQKKEIDLVQLAKDLRNIKQQFVDSEEISQALASAISAADKGNGAKTLKHLGKVGQWILDTATKIGADVAATAIKRIYGLS